MRILGLTGSIGMGKTTAAKMFRDLNVPVHDADAVVHTLLAPGGDAVADVLDAFPDAGEGNEGGGVDRRKLGAAVFGDDAALKRLEAILHPRVQAAERAFRDACRREGRALVVLEIPLLFETGAEARCDAVCVVTAPAAIQRERVLSRPGMTEEKFEQILARQMPDDEKCKRADFLIQSGLGHHRALQQVREIARLMTEPSWSGGAGSNGRTGE